MQDTHQNIINICASLELKVDCLSSGPLTATVAIVSDYPGETEAKTKLPFSGEAGKPLWQALKPKFYRAEVYTTNVIKRVVQRGEKLRKSELELWKSVLDVELGMLPNLKYILVLGSQALEGLLGMHGITEVRGSVLPYKDKLCLVSYNPAYTIEKEIGSNVVKDGNRLVIFNFDIGKFKNVIAGHYKPVEIQTVIIDTMAAFEELVKLCYTVPYVSVDIEHLNNETACIGFAVDSKVGYVLPFFDTEKNLWTVEEEEYIRLKLCEMLATVPVVGQNISSDLCWLWYKDRIRIGNVVGDTLLAHHLLYPTLPHNLGFLVSQYTWQPFYKDDGKDWKIKGDIRQYWEYNAKDTTLTWQIHEELLDSLKAAGLLDIYHNHVIRVLPHLCRATVVGIDVDTRKKAVLDRYYTAKFNKKKAALTELAKRAYTTAGGEEIQDFNPSSPAQVAELLYTVFKCPADRKNSTDITQLNKLLALRSVSTEAKEFIEALKSFRKDQKFLSTYVRTPIDEDRKFRTHYYQFGTTSAPGRLSSGGNQWGTASNIQNQPPQSRQMFVCPTGYKFVYIDLAQAEARYVGWDANIPSWIEEFEAARMGKDIDCHRSLASRIFGVPYDEVPTADHDKDNVPTIRYLGKRARHGLNYRMMVSKFAEATGVSMATAQYVFEAYHKETPELAKWWKRLEIEVKASKAKTGVGTLYNALGRRLAILGALDDNTLRSIVAFRPQSTIGDWLQRVWYLCHEDSEWPNEALIVLNVHDSLTAICRDSDVNRVAKLLVHHAQQPIDVNGRPLIIPADCKVSVADKKGVHRWSTLKGYKLTG